MYNPKPNDNYNEWIELYNPTNHDINLSYWIIEDNFKGVVVYSDAACALNIEELQDTVEVRIKHYVHPYLSVFTGHNIEQLKFEYAEDNNSFVFIGIQK